MDKTLFEIPLMDCAVEENMVRVKLEPIQAVRGLEVDLAGRNLTVFHEGDLATVEGALQDRVFAVMTRGAFRIFKLSS